MSESIGTTGKHNKNNVTNKVEKIEKQVAKLPRRLEKFLFREPYTIADGKDAGFMTGSHERARAVDLDSLSIVVKEYTSSERRANTGLGDLRYQGQRFSIFVGPAVALGEGASKEETIHVKFTVDENGSIVTKGGNAYVFRRDMEKGKEKLDVVASGEGILPAVANVSHVIAELVKRDDQEKLGGSALRHIMVGFNPKHGTFSEARESADSMRDK